MYSLIQDYQHLERKMHTDSALLRWQGYSDSQRVWHHLVPPCGIANNLSLHNVKVTYDSSEKTGFIIHIIDSTNCVFMHSKRGVYSLILGVM